MAMGVQLVILVWAHLMLFSSPKYTDVLDDTEDRKKPLGTFDYGIDEERNAHNMR